MYFLAFFLLCTLSLSTNCNLQNPKSKLDFSSKDIFQDKGDKPTQKNESLSKSSDLLPHKNNMVTDFGRNIEGNFNAYFGYCNETLDGVWKFTPYDLNVDHLSKSIMSHEKGRISLNFKCVEDTRLGDIIQIDIDLYDGNYKNRMLKFYLDFMQDFKIYKKNIITMGKNEENIHFFIYNFIHRSNGFNYTVNATIAKILSTDEISMRIESNQAGFNGIIRINLNVIYLGWISSFCIKDYIVCNIIVFMICIFCVNTKIFNMKNDDISHICVSPITIAISIIWNILLMLEYFYLAFTCEEYFLLYVLVILQFLTTAYLYYFLIFIYSRFEEKFICIKYQIFICAILFMLSIPMFTHDLLFDCKFLTLICGFIWVPQIALNLWNGFTNDNGYLILSLSLNFICFPLLTKLFKSNIFELEPNYEWMKEILFIISIQIAILKLQEICKRNFFITRILRQYLFKFNSIKISYPLSNYFECVICFDNASNPNTKIAEIPCGHSFHYSCLCDWLKQKNQCAICRKKVFDTETEYKRFHFNVLI